MHYEHCCTTAVRCSGITPLKVTLHAQTANASIRCLKQATTLTAKFCTCAAPPPTTCECRHSGVGEKLYRNTKAALQKVLGVTSKATARELCIQFGCARHDASVRAALAAYKERFVRSLPAVQQAHVDFGRAVFLAAAFFLVARKHKVAVSACLLACLPPSPACVCTPSLLQPFWPNRVSTLLPAAWLSPNTWPHGWMAGTTS